MKKCVLWLLLLCAGFPLSAKSSSSYYIYIQPVSGVGKSPEDNYLFADFLADEVTANNHIITENLKKANFVLTPELSLISGEKPSEQLYLLHIILSDNKTDAVLTEQDLICSTPEEGGSLLMVAMGNVFSVISDIYRVTTEWRNKWLYLGAYAFWTPRIYSYGNHQETKLLNIGAGVSAELQFLNFMSLETGAALVPEWIGILYVDGADRHDLILEMPLLLKFPLKPGRFQLIEPYGGIRANYPLYGVGCPPLLSWCAGLQYGIKAGPGMIFLDTRFSMDIGNLRLKKTKDAATIIYSNKYQIDAGLGYKFGFFSR